MHRDYLFLFTVTVVFTCFNSRVDSLNSTLVVTSV